MRRAFTLIEILMVVIMLGLLAAIVIPQFMDFSGESRQTAFISSAKICVAAAKRYELDYGEYPDAQSGMLPDGFGDYILSMKWEYGTPIGGEWQAQAPIAGIRSALGVRYRGNDPDHDPAAMQAIDEIVDDGNLQTGAFRQFGGRRYFFIVAR